MSGDGAAPQEEERPGALSRVAEYFKNRGNDFLDVFPCSVAWGGGLYAGARVGVVAVGVGAEQTQRAGFPVMPVDEHGQPVSKPIARAGTWKDASIGAGVLTVQTKVMSDDEWADDSSYAILLGALPVSTCGPQGYPKPFLRHGLDVEAGVHVGVVGVRVGVSPMGLVDFVLGWFGLDVSDDDVFGK